MQSKDIEIFLNLVNTRSITKTAENLFVAQSAISTRLKHLESELGYELFTRGKGIREIELTVSGREFVGIAMRLANLYEEAALLKEQASVVLRLASPESVYFDFLEPLMTTILTKYPEVKVNCVTSDSSGVYELIENGLIDYGFASYESAHTKVSHSHIYDQDFCLMSEAYYYPDGSAVSPDMLDPAKEIRLIGGNFTNVWQWRDTWFTGKDRCRVEVNSPHMIVKSLKEMGSWAILPLATARELSRLYGVHICNLTDLPESRKIYLLRQTGSQNETAAVKIFEMEMKAYLEERKNQTITMEDKK